MIGIYRYFYDAESLPPNFFFKLELQNQVFRYTFDNLNKNEMQFNNTNIIPIDRMN